MVDPAGDAGQTIFGKCRGYDNSYAFRVDIKNPAVKSVYFSAQCTSRPITVGATDSIVMANTSFGD